MTPTTSPTLLTPSPTPHPRTKRYSVRFHARLEEDTSTKLNDLAKTLYRKRGPTLRYVMQWGLAHTTGWAVDQSIPDRPHLVHMLVDPELLDRVQDAADAHGVSIAAWLQHAMRQVTVEDFPASWRAEGTTPRSHESGYYHRKFGLRLDDETSRMPRDHGGSMAVVERRHRMRPSRGVFGWLPWVLLTACVASHPEAPTALRSSGRTPGVERPALDRLLTAGDIQIAEGRLKAFGFDPGPVDGVFTAQTQAAVRAFQARYGLTVSGLLDRETREELKLGVDPPRTG